MLVERRTSLPVSADQAFAWYGRPGACERLLPPWEQVRVVDAPAGRVPRSASELELGIGPVRRRWVLRRETVEPGRRLLETQDQGPFARWRHERRLLPREDGTCDLTDRVDFELPGGPIGELGEPIARRRLLRILKYGHRVVAGDLALHAAQAGDPLRVAVTGASGLVGRTLRQVLTTGGHTVIPMVRRPAGPDEISWDPAAGRLDPTSLDGVDAVVHLAGESIASGRWTEARKRAIRTSRIDGTGLLARAIAGASPRPSTLVTASAMGIYGDRNDEVLDESSAPGEGFLAEVGQAWEAASAPAEEAGVRVVVARSGLVLSPAGGVLAQLQTPFALGGGAVLGDGNHWMSWISIDDAVGAIVHALRHPGITGPVNLSTPTPVRNDEFSRTLGRVLRRPVFLRLPAAALRLAVGDLADEALLASTRMRPGVLVESGYAFRHATLETALRHVLGRAI